MVVFLLLVIGGRYALGPNADVKALPPEAASSTAASQTNDSSLKNTQAQATDTNASAPSCAQNLAAEIISKKESYAKGQILVTFKKGETYQDSKNVLAVYGLVIQNENNSQASFAARRLVTAAVSPGQEIVKVCLLRSDSHVVYAGLDLYFGLHE